MYIICTTHRAKCWKGTQRSGYDDKSLKELTHQHRSETDTLKEALDQSRA